jgi:hypothetical protein
MVQEAKRVGQPGSSVGVATDLDTEHGGTDANDRDVAGQVRRLNVADVQLCGVIAAEGVARNNIRLRVTLHIRFHVYVGLRATGMLGARCPARGCPIASTGWPAGMGK